MFGVCDCQEGTHFHNEHATSTVRHDLTTIKQSNFALGIDWYLQTPPLFLSSLALPLL